MKIFNQLIIQAKSPHLFYLSILLFLSLSAAGQGTKVSSNALQKLGGEWEGALTYTDYKDDLSTTTLKCKVVGTWKGKKVKFAIGFVEPNGVVIYDKVTLKLLKKGYAVKFDGNKYKVDNFEKIGPSDHWKLVMSFLGKDNNRNANIKQNINYTQNSLIITKEVKYADKSNYFVRSKYVFNRI